MKKQLSLSLILVLLCACTPSGAVSVEESQTREAVDGSYSVGNESVRLNYVYAHKMKSVAGDKDYDIVVLLTDKPISVEMTSENIEHLGFFMKEHNLRCLELEFTRNNLFLGRDPSRKDWGFHYGHAHHGKRGITFDKSEEGIKLEQAGNTLTGSAKATGIRGDQTGDLSFSVSFKATLKDK